MLPAATAEISELIRGPIADQELGRAAALLARIEYPDLEIRPVLEQLDRFADSVDGRLSGRRDGDAAVSAINQLLFEELDFQGNRHDYYDPRNSFLNDVLQRRTGIPISLSVVYLEIARKLDLPIHGVALPCHFLVKYHQRPKLFFIDPYHEGRLLNKRGCSELVRTLNGRPVELTDLHFAAVSDQHIILRMCNNLRGIYLTSRQYRKALQVIELILALEPNSPDELKQRAWLNQELGHRKQALNDLEIYAALRPDGQDAQDVQKWIGNIRRTLARLN